MRQQQRRSTGHGTARAPVAVTDVLRRSGRSLQPDERRHAEAAFGCDFSRVRVHTGDHAARAAESVGAAALTVGNDVVLGADVHSSDVRHGVLQHELTHVVQQRGAAAPSTLQVAPATHALEIPAQRAAAGGEPGRVGRVGARVVQRMVKINDPKKKIPKPGGKGVDKTNAEVVEAYVTKLCSDSAVKVDTSGGGVTVDTAFCTPKGKNSSSPAEKSTTKTGCTCLCDLSRSKHPWRITVDDAEWPNTDYDDYPKAYGDTPGGTGGIVTVSSPNSPKTWGAAEKSGKLGHIPGWLVLGHELCGHAWLANQGMQPKTPDRGKGGHQKTVARENLIRAEHGLDARGGFKDPYCGESFWRTKKKPSKLTWSKYLAVCRRWRRDYNRRHGTKYTIYDRIP